MKVLLASDHAGFALKAVLKDYLRGLGYEIEDEGPYALDDQDDYPDYVSIVAKIVASDPENCRGIVIGGSGQGEAMCANRYRGVRAAVLYSYDEHAVNLSRLHNDANVLSIGARFVSEDDAKKAVRLWLSTPFSGEERHLRRIRKIDSDTTTIHEF